MAPNVLCMVRGLGPNWEKTRPLRDFRETLKATIYTYFFTVVDWLNNTHTYYKTCTPYIKHNWYPLFNCKGFWLNKVWIEDSLFRLFFLGPYEKLEGVGQGVSLTSMQWLGSMLQADTIHRCVLTTFSLNIRWNFVAETMSKAFLNACHLLTYSHQVLLTKGSRQEMSLL